MQKTLSLAGLLLTSLVLSWLKVSATETMTVSFITLGNCAICEDRIETAINKLDGIEAAHWDLTQDVTTVTYDISKTDPFIIMDAIAYVGHDTEWYRAPDSAYNLLIGTCCEYERTLDYSNVQIGYLSLMGIWISPLGISAVQEETSQFSVLPALNEGTFVIRQNSDRFCRRPEVAVFSLSGQPVYQESFTGELPAMFDVRFLPAGIYFVRISDGNKTLAASRIVIR